MPKPVVFKANSVVYFQGDVDDRIYILKAGRIVLRSRDIETGQELNDLIQTGEFFGVKSALGHFAREENAIALSDAQVIQFSVPEFEALISANHRIVIKMLKVFSNQLRRIHSKVTSMLDQEDQVDPEAGLHNSATFYHHHKQYDYARYIWTRYLELYPTGRFVNEARTNLGRSEQSAAAQATRAESQPAKGGQELNDAGRAFFEGESLFAQDKFPEALKRFRRAVELDPRGEYGMKAQYEIGHCLFEAGDNTGTIKHFSQLLKLVPRHPRLGEILFLIGSAYQRGGDAAKARAFLTKALGSAADDPTLRRKIDRTLREMAE